MKGAAPALLAVAVLFWCCAHIGANPIPPFAVPDTFSVYAQNTEDFFSYYENLYPSTHGTVLYGARAARTQSTGRSDYTQNIILQKQSVAEVINTTTANTALVLGTTFTAYMSHEDVFLFYEGTPKGLYTDLYTAHYNLTTRQLRTQPIKWINPPIPEPTYNTTGAFLGNVINNNSEVVNRQNSYGSYMATFSLDGLYVYVLVRTRFFGSLKLLKYNVQDGSLIWRQIIKPEVQGRSGVLPLGVGYIQIDLISRDLFLLQDVDEQEMAAMYKYLNTTHSGPFPSSGGNVLMRVDHNTGNIVDSTFIDLDSVPGGSPFNQYINPTSMIIFPSESGPLLFITIHGELKTNPINQADILLQYSINDLNNNKGTRKSVLLSLFPQAVADACHPATVSFLVRSTAFLGRYLLITGDAGYRQELTGSVTAGGKAFIARIDPIELVAQNTTIKMEYFGVNSRDNSAGEIVVGPDLEAVYWSAVVNRGLTHDPPDKQGQNAMIFVENNNNPVLACFAGQDWWLMCKDGGCLEWCFPFPNVTGKHNPFQECTPAPSSDDDDDWSDATIAGVVIGIAAGLFVFVLLIVAVVWGLYKLRQHHRGYVEVDGGVDHKINETITRGLK